MAETRESRGGHGGREPQACHAWQIRTQRGTVGLEPRRPAPAFRARIVPVRPPSLCALRCGELAYLALHPIALAITLHRRDRVVVGRPRLEAPHVHAECRLRMALVQPDGV